jgi:ferrochelatase
MANKAILLVNLGSPDSYQIPDVKKYLDEFLMDGRVIDYPYFFRFLLVKGIILNTRPPKSAEAYKSIWWDEGSPLIVLSKRLQKKVQEYSEIPVGLGMRYGNPSIEFGIGELKDQNPDLEEVLLVPLYPHYAMSSYETVVVKAQGVMQKKFPDLKMKVKSAFFDDERYIDILSASIKPALEKEYDHILFSYHGIPERHVRKSDVTKGHCLSNGNCCKVKSPAHEFCYRHQVLDTTRQVVEKLGLPEGKYSTSFQSRLGRDPWLQPFTDQTINEMPARGIKKLVVVCPAFVSDCLETIEEIGVEARKEFLEHGGEEFTMIPCLNEDADWAQLLAQWGVEELNKEEATV